MRLLISDVGRLYLSKVSSRFIEKSSVDDLDFAFDMGDFLIGEIKEFIENFVIPIPIQWKGGYKLKAFLGKIVSRRFEGQKESEKS